MPDQNDALARAAALADRTRRVVSNAETLRRWSEQGDERGHELAEQIDQLQEQVQLLERLVVTLAHSQGIEPIPLELLRAWSAGRNVQVSFELDGIQVTLPVHGTPPDPIAKWRRIQEIIRRDREAP